MTLSLALLLSCPTVFPAQERAGLVLVSYNIHHAEGVDGKLSLERIADDIRHADIVALQEVDNNFGQRSEFANQAESLADSLNMYYVYAANLDFDASTVENGKIRNARRQYGTAILSRYPIEFSRNYPLPKIEYTNLSSEQRGLLEAQVDIGGKKLRVYCTHLAATSAEQRLLQIKAVKDIVSRAGIVGAPQGNSPLAASFVLMGDFNFRPDSEPYTILTGEFRRGNQLFRAGGFVDFWPLVSESEGNTVGVRSERGSRIDYVFVSPDLAKLAKSAAINTETVASDHQPLTAVLNGF
jgi:endonuclease/exonuclease/phosphatase family metal-dependent hydrolase